MNVYNYQLHYRLELLTQERQPLVLPKVFFQISDLKGVLVLWWLFENLYFGMGAECFQFEET
jgi:hypothetical protein